MPALTVHWDFIHVFAIWWFDWDHILILRSKNLIFIAYGMWSSNCEHECVVNTEDNFMKFHHKIPSCIQRENRFIIINFHCAVQCSVFSVKCMIQVQCLKLISFIIIIIIMEIYFGGKWSSSENASMDQNVFRPFHASCTQMSWLSYNVSCVLCVVGYTNHHMQKCISCSFAYQNSLTPEHKHTYNIFESNEMTCSVLIQ